MNQLLLRMLLAFMICTALSAAEQPAAEPLLMGYAKLDGAGLPTDVRVALTRAQFTALWSVAHPEETATAPVVELATGAPRWRIAVRDEGATVLAAELRLPVAVLADGWRQVRLPVPSGSVVAVSSEPLSPGGPVPATGSVTWQGEPDALVLSIAGRTQATIVVRLSVPLVADGGQWALSVPLLPGGGGMDLAVAPGWEPLSAQATFTRTVDGLFTADLPTRSERLALRLRRADAAAPREVHLALEQRLLVTLQLDRLLWTADIDLAIQGGTLRELHLLLPAGLVLGNIDSPGLAGWRQTGSAVDLTWAAAVGGPVQVRASGILPHAPGDGVAGVAVALDCPGAERLQGRLGLVGRGERAQRIERLIADGDTSLLRAEPAEGEDLAVRWNDRPAGLRVRWEQVGADLHAVMRAAAVVDAQHVQVAARLVLSGRGTADGLRLKLPPPWRVLRVGGSGATAITSGFIGDGAERILLMRSATALTAGNDVTLWLAADRVQLGDGFDLPDLWSADGLAMDRQSWLLGDDGGRRLTVAPTPQSAVTATTPLAAEFASELPTGAGWRQAFERRGGTPLRLALVAESPRMTVTASHYLVLEAERLRWSARLVFTPQQGDVLDLVCRLPTGARLVRSSCRDLGSLILADDGLLTARLTAPACGSTTLDLDLELAVDGASPLRVAAITTPAGTLLATQQVALVEDYELGLVHRTVEGLGEQPELPLALPAGVDASQVKLRWSAQRPDWSLTLRREPLVPAGGLDGIATMIDAYGAIAPDGELRSRATWHVLNRSRQQLRLAVPAGVELWEVRVDGRQVSCRRDPADAAVVWVPVRPLRAGEAASRVELTWRQLAGASSSPLHPVMPVFSELKPQQVLWRFAPPSGWSVSRRDGALRPIAATDADTERAKRVVEELARLRGQGELKDNALLRANDQLDQLELELNDYLVQMNTTGSQQAKEIEGQIGQLRDDRLRNSSVFGQRAGSRKALGIGQRTRDWASAAAPSSSPVALVLPADLPWREALSVESRASLGEGTPPPGHRAAGGRTMLGIDLVGDAPVGLTLRGIGGDFTVELVMTRDAVSWWSALLSAGVAFGLLVVAVISHRRQRIR